MQPDPRFSADPWARWNSSFTGADVGTQGQAAPTPPVAQSPTSGTGTPVSPVSALQGNSDPSGMLNAGLQVANFDRGGGVIPNDSDDDESDGTLAQDQAADDPLAMLRNAIFAGQKMYGIKSPMYGGASMQGADGGGMIDDPQNQPPTDPRAVAEYMAGGNAIPAEMAEALKQQVDPTGNMDPQDRLRALAQRIKDPNVLYHVLAHERTLANGHMAGAKAALRMGQMGLAAHHATEAFSHIPNTHSVKFAPMQGGLAMISKPVGQQPMQQPQMQDDDEEQGAAEGGVISTDETNPTNLLRSYEGGGGVDSDDPTDDGSSGVTGSWGRKAIDAVGGMLQGAVTSQGNAEQATAGDVSGGLSMDSVMGANEPAQRLSVQDADKIFTPEATDKLAEQSWDEYIKEKVGNWIGGSAAPNQYKFTGFEVGNGASEGGPEETGLPEGEGEFANRVAPGKNMTTPEPEPKFQTAPYSQRSIGQPPAEPTEPDETAKLEKRLKAINRIAMGQFPAAGQAKEREAFVQSLLKQFGDQDTAEKKGNYDQKLNMLTLRGQQKLDEIAATQKALGERARAGRENRLRIEKLKTSTTLWEKNQQQLLGAAMNLIKGDPSLKPADALEQLRGTAQKLGIDPDKQRQAVEAAYGMQEGDEDEEPAPRRGGFLRGQEPEGGYPQVMHKKDGTTMIHVGNGQYVPQ